MQRGKKITLQAPAKINWSLEITGQREDGYHLLRSLMQQVDLYDRVTLSTAEGDCCLCSGIPAQENLALRAWKRLKAALGLKESLEIRIEKNIPMGAGLAGGSTDAAATLLGAVQLLKLEISQEQLFSIGLSLGADIPFCLAGGACLVQGIGEKLTFLENIPARTLLLVNPGFPVSTPRVYQVYDQVGSNAQPDVPGLLRILEGDLVGEPAAVWGNQLYEAACQLHPQLLELENALRELGLAPLMSGSGGSFFAVCPDAEQAEEKCAALTGRFPWVQVVHTIGRGQR